MFRVASSDVMSILDIIDIRAVFVKLKQADTQTDMTSPM
jgi:hypothetical protein